MVEEFDVLIKNANIVDGVNKRFKGSLGVNGERISEIGEIKGDAKKIIDAEGLIATPGFIDSHSHADWSLPWYPNCESEVMQGCTTVVSGMCGDSPGPIKEFLSPPSVIYDEIFYKKPYLYHQPSLLNIDTVNEILEKKYGWVITWRTMSEFFNFVERKGISINYTPFVGHGTIRYSVMEEDYKRESSTAETEQMKVLMRHPMCATGLDVSIVDEGYEYKAPPYGLPLPDVYCGYPKFLIRYVREDNFLTLEEAVYKCSTLPAKIYDLKDRGTLKVGAYADITLLDLPHLEIVGAPELSNRYPKGIQHVIINGKIVVDNGSHTGERPGKILKRKCACD